MQINAFIFCRKNYEMHYLNKIMMISTQSVLNIKKF